MPLLDLYDRLIGMRWVGNQSPVGTVNQQIECFQYRLPDDYLVTKNKCVFNRVSPIDVNLDRPSDVDGLLSPIRQFHDSLSADCKIELLHHVERQDSAHRSSVYQRIGPI